MNRRDLIALLGGTAAAWPLGVRAQQQEGMRRIGVLTGVPAADPEAQTRFATFLQALQHLGWNEGRNVRIDYRPGADTTDRVRQSAAELVGLAPDVIVATTGGIVGALQQVSPLSTRWAAGSWTAWPIQAATPPASCSLNTA
jgi:putative tryptophan/tyrosine transport system substrate-binding protein